jgi:hypothetical protein
MATVLPADHVRVLAMNETNVTRDVLEWADGIMIGWVWGGHVRGDGMPRRCGGLIRLFVGLGCHADAAVWSGFWLDWGWLAGWLVMMVMVAVVVALVVVVVVVAVVVVVVVVGWW